MAVLLITKHCNVKRSYYREKGKPWYYCLKDQDMALSNDYCPKSRNRYCFDYECIERVRLIGGD